MIKTNKALVFDSSAIITLALNDLLYILKPLKQLFKGSFFIPETVKKEVIDTPLKGKRFALEALNIKLLLDEGTIEEISTKEIKNESVKVLRLANTTYKVNNQFISIIHEGEASCLALYKLLDSEKKAIVCDERTTRMLCEAPQNLKELLQRKLHKKVEMEKENSKFFEKINLIRSSELCYIAYKNGIIKLPTNYVKGIEAISYALKFKGCAISTKEIEAMKRLRF